MYGLNTTQSRALRSYFNESSKASDLLQLSMTLLRTTLFVTGITSKLRPDIIQQVLRTGCTTRQCFQPSKIVVEAENNYSLSSSKN